MTTTRTYKIGAREIEKNEIVEVETLCRFGPFTPTAGPTFVGRLLYANEREVCLSILRGIKKIPQVEVRSAQILTSEQCAQRFQVGDNVRIDKFASVYQGVVEKVGRTRVTVRYRTNKDRREGTSHTATVPAADLVRIRNLI